MPNGALSEGEFNGLLIEATCEAAERPKRARERDEFEDAVAMVKLSELSRARQRLTSLGLAPGNDATRRELLDRELRALERAHLPEGLAQFSFSEHLVWITGGYWLR